MDPLAIQDLLNRAILEEKKGAFDAARTLLEQVIASELPPQSRSLDARQRLGKLLIDAGHEKYAEAERVLTEARELAQKLTAPRAAATVVHLLALLERHRRHPEAAQALLDASPVAIQAANPSSARGQWLHYNGLVAQDRNELNSAEKFFFRAHQVYRESNDPSGLSEVCNSLAGLLLRRGKTLLALRFAGQGLETKLEIGDLYGQAISHGTRGRANLQLGEYDAAATAFEQDLGIVRQYGLAGEGQILNSLAEVELLRKDVPKAEQYCRQALQIKGDPTHTVHAQIGLARVLLAAGRVKEAELACDDAQTVIDGHGVSPGLRERLRGYRGALAWRKKDFETGERELTTAIDALRNAGFKLDTIPLLYDLRDLHIARQSRARAVETMREALNLLNECGSERGVEDVEEWLRTVDVPKLVQLALEQYIPEWVVQDAIQGRLKRPPSRKIELAVLFSDIQGFTPLTETLGPVQIVEFLNEWFAEATRIVRKHNGVVDKFIGDAVMALFGVPDPRPDAAAAADAVRAALEMREALAAINMRQQALDQPSIGVGIGVALGEAVVGLIGSHLRRSYTAIGGVVNTAARLEAATRKQKCDILITAEVEQAQDREGVAETQFEGMLALKGLEDTPTAAYRVIGPRGFVTAAGS